MLYNHLFFAVTENLNVQCGSEELTPYRCNVIKIMIYITFQIGGLGLNLLTVEQTPSTSWRGQHPRIARMLKNRAAVICPLCSPGATGVRWSLPTRQRQRLPYQCLTSVSPIPAICRFRSSIEASVPVK